MTNHREIQALIWDLGGVILRTEDLSYREVWEKRFGLGAWDLERLVFRSEASRRASVGQASVNDIWASVQAELELTAEEIKQLREDFFAGDRVDEKLVTFIRSLKEKYRIGMITNAWPDIRQWLEEEARIADAFDHIVVSSEVGIVKPKSEVYLLSLKGLGVQPEQAIFIDDFIENIEAAEAIGMVGIHFREPAEAMQSIREQLDTSS